jgi:hypothetical protein
MSPKYHYPPVSVYQLVQAGWLMGALFIDVTLLATLYTVHDVLTVSHQKSASCLNTNTVTLSCTPRFSLTNVLYIHIPTKK